MSRRVALSPRAQADIDDIWEWTAGRFGIEQAERYLRRLQADAAMIASAPEHGRPCPEIRAGYRKFRSGSHLLFYKVSERTVEIVRVLHVGMDFVRHLS